jgi:amidohydrolase
MTVTGSELLEARARIERDAGLFDADVIGLGRRIYNHPELSGEEHMARRWCTELLARHGFEIADVPGAETAFVATATCTSSGPTIGLLAEYDALPGVGHACGHHLIAGSAVGAGLALAAQRDSLPGVIKVFGCPAEETGVGKAAMLERGVFAGTDAALTFHANDVSSVLTRSTAIHELCFTFSGRPSHAATAPWDGASALDGVLLTYQNVNALRQFIRDGVRIHGIVTHGGDAFNVVPESASCRLAVRSADATELARVVQRVTECARAAALASATTLAISTGMRVESVKLNAPLAGLVRASLNSLGEPCEDWDLLGSTDFGNVSSVLPAVLFSIATWPRGTAFHTREAATAAGEPRAFEAMLKAGRLMARASVDLLQSPDLLRTSRDGLGDDPPPNTATRPR